MTLDNVGICYKQNAQILGVNKLKTPLASLIFVEDLPKNFD